MFKHLHCPLCKSTFDDAQTRVVRCANGHSFDLAKEGYLNLLPVNAKRSKQPGDSAAMVAARRHWLGKGHYQPLVDEIGSYLAHLSEFSYLDLCCGEGYYTRQLAQNAESYIGVDISKFAVKAAAKADSRGVYAVASTRDIPVDTASFDVVTCLFGFYSPDEVLRVLKPGGEIILVHTGPNHLIEARRAIYQDVRETVFTPPEFTNTRSVESSLSYTIECDAEQTLNLIEMTPHAYRVAKDVDVRERLSALVKHTLDFRIYQIKDQRS